MPHPQGGSVTSPVFPARVCPRSPPRGVSVSSLSVKPALLCGSLHSSRRSGSLAEKVLSAMEQAMSPSKGTSDFPRPPGRRL